MVKFIDMSTIKYINNNTENFTELKVSECVSE